MKDRKYLFILLLIVAATGYAFRTPAFAQGVTKPQPVMSKVVEGMPTSAKQQIRVMTAEFKPGDRTVFHTHRFPVTVYILEGAFTLEVEGKERIVVKAGESFVEPPKLKMTGFNRSQTEKLKLVIFYVSDEGSPFLDMVDHSEAMKVDWNGYQF